MTERSVGTFLSISAVSMSNWMIVLPARNFTRSPATRSEKRMPHAMIVSARRKDFAAASVPCMPTSPKNCSSEAG